MFTLAFYDLTAASTFVHDWTGQTQHWWF